MQSSIEVKDRKNTRGQKPNQIIKMYQDTHKPGQCENYFGENKIVHRVFALHKLIIKMIKHTHTYNCMCKAWCVNSSWNY